MSAMYSTNQKKSETIKQLSSKVHDLQNTQLIHSTQQSVRSTMSKELLNTQQTALMYTNNPHLRMNKTMIVKSYVFYPIHN